MAQPSRVVAFLSDFGSRDPYVAIVKAVIEKISAGKVRVIDISHDVPGFSVVAGAYVLYTSYRYFPRGTVFLVVIDPGVGTERRALAVRTSNYYFVGPDNGVLYPAITEDGVVEARVISNEAVFLKPVSKSFHGRDVFGPAAALLALGVPLEALGPRIEPEKLVRLELRKRCEEETVEAMVVYVDHFGNAALGLDKECLEKLCQRGSIVAETRGRRYRAKCLPVFSMAEKGELVFYLNSLGFPELAVNLGSAAQLLGIGIGDVVRLYPA